MHRDWWLPLANLHLVFEFDFFDFDTLEGCSSRTLKFNLAFCGTRAPPAAVAVGFDSLSCSDSCSPHRSGPMNVAAGLDYGISFSDHIHSRKGYVPVALWPVYPLLPRGVPY